MKKQIAFSLAVVGLLIIASVLIWKQRASRTQETTSAQPSPATKEAASELALTTATQPKPGAEVVPPVTRAAAAPAQSTPRKAVIDLTAPVDPAKHAEVSAVLSEQKALYADVGTLSWDETKALIAKRQKSAAELLDRLARLGPGGARAIAAVYPEIEDTRARLLLVTALGRVGDPEASAVLAALMVRDNSFSVRKEMVVALGQRHEPAANAVLADLLQNQDDARLRAASVQALAGRAEALPVLAARIRTDTSPDVRQESIRSVGLIGNEAAKEELAGIAKGSLESGVRQAAIQELARSFDTGAMSILEVLLNDSSENIRLGAVRGIARIHSDQASALLQRAASTDSSASIRELAKQSLASTP